MIEEDLISQIFERSRKDGFGESTEQFEICMRALNFRNFSYKRSEELDATQTVDCSTLTSQSHWEGALIGIPFVADNQRTATSGIVISSFDDMVPADVLIKYPSIEASSDKTWNHVGLYLGRDADGIQWLIESTGKTGVRLSTLDIFNPQGGIKRFTLTQAALDSVPLQNALSLAPSVPKFGRLGVRQYRKSGAARLPHKGLDLYIPAGHPVYCTISGMAQIVHDEIEHSMGIQVTGEEFIVRYLMLDENTVALKNDTAINAGDLLGNVGIPSERSDVQYSPPAGRNSTSHLHLEAEAVESAVKERIPYVDINGHRYFNHLYLSKLHMLPLPFQER